MSNDWSDESKTRLFISYAWENAPVAEWLARKLMCCGYSIWIDKLFLRGGCTWPEDIDDAIKNRSFRMIHLLSKYSLTKPNPSKERQLGFSISKKCPGFLIPLNIDVPTEELPWQLTDVQYIPFQDWREGFKQLILALEEAHCPKEFLQNGIEEAIRTYFPVDVILDKPEPIFSNVFKIKRYPKELTWFRSEFQVSRDEAFAMGWPVFLLDRAECVSFWPPPEGLAVKYKISEVCKVSCEKKVLNEVPTYNIIKSLLLLTVYEMAKERGFTLNDKKDLVFPKMNNVSRYSFRCFGGETTWFNPHGYSNHNGVYIDYSLSFRPVVTTIDGDFHVIISLRITTYYANGQQVEPSKRISIRKAIVKSWWNHQWYMKYSGIMSYLSKGGDEIIFGTNEDDKVIMSAMPIMGMSPQSLADDKIRTISKARASKLSQAEISAIKDGDSEEGGQDEE